MKGRLITAKMIVGFKEHLILEERSTATIQKYIRDVKAFAEYANGAVIKETVIAYKKHLQECYAVRSINSMLASINSLFAFLARFESEIIKVATAGLLPRRKRTYKGGIHTPLPCGAK
jgi:hypothetical protein